MSDPTDLELMMFADGELDGERGDEVRAYLEGSSEARLKLKAMGIVGELVRRDANHLATAFRADDIAAAVFAKLEADAPAAEKAGARVEKSGPRLRDVSAPGVKQSAPANDNARFIYGLAGLAAAAAFALWMWGSGSRPSPLPPGEGPVAQAPTEAAPQPAATAPERAAAATPSATSTSEAATPDANEPSVRVASVNWGENKPGTVYYVPADGEGATTTVVWLAAE